MEIFKTGGKEYYICFNNARHELYESVDGDDIPDNLIDFGTYLWCKEVIGKIIESNK